MDLKVTRDGGAVRYLEGLRFGLQTSLFRAEVTPGSGPGEHRHDYPEIFVLQEGRGEYVVDGDVLAAEAGDIVIVPAGAWHSFRNPGRGVLKHIAIHEAPQRRSTPRSGNPADL